MGFLKPSYSVFFFSVVNFDSESDLGEDFFRKNDHHRKIK